MTRYLRLPNYANNLRRLGFTDDDLAGPSDRLIDAIVVCGTVDDVVARVAEHHVAGADHVCIQVLTASPTDLPMREWAELAVAFGLQLSVTKGAWHLLSRHLVEPLTPMMAWAAARRAIGTRNGEQLT